MLNSSRGRVRVRVRVRHVACSTLCLHRERSICTIKPYRPSLHTQSALFGGIMYSAPALCIPHHFLWAPFYRPTYIGRGELLHSASASCIAIGCSGQCTALGPILHSAFCICILHRVQCTALVPICILHLHPAFGCSVHSFGADSAFCILHLHPASGAVNNFGSTTHISPYRIRRLICAPFSHGQVCGYDSSPELTRCSLGPAGSCYVRPPGRVARAVGAPQEVIARKAESAPKL